MARKMLSEETPTILPYALDPKPNEVPTITSGWWGTIRKINYTGD
jgi:hypothetical protein